MDPLFYRSQYTRTSDDIKSMIKLAKLNEKHLTELTQVIYYGDMENNPDWKLLELNGAIQSAIEEGQVLCFKGIDCLFIPTFLYFTIVYH